MTAQLERDGFEMRRGMAGASDLASLRDEASSLQWEAGKVCVRDIFRRSKLLEKFAVSQVPRDGMIPVRGILFDKTPEGNWPVPWHQDLSIAVGERPEEVPEGFGAWSVKDGVPHVQAPVVLLEEMITVRVHLDDTPEENGALRVLAGSHQSGRLAADQIAAWASGNAAAVCGASAGDALLMKPLLLHSSARSSVAGNFSHRRVIHLEFAPEEALAPSLNWYGA